MDDTTHEPISFAVKNGTAAQQWSEAVQKIVTQLESLSDPASLANIERLVTFSCQRLTGQIPATPHDEEVVWALEILDSAIDRAVDEGAVTGFDADMLRDKLADIEEAARFDVLEDEDETAKTEWAEQNAQLIYKATQAEIEELWQAELKHRREPKVTTLGDEADQG